MSPADGGAATLPLHPCSEVWSLHGGMVGDSDLDAEASAVVQAALGGRARTMARQGDAWREVVLDAASVPERMEIVAREADPLVVVVTLDRTRCSGTQDDRAPAWHDLDAAVELRLGDEVIDRWQASGVVAEFVPASEMMQTTATIHVGTRAQHGLAQARDFGMIGILPAEAGLPPAPRLPLALAQDRSALLASLNDGPLVAWQSALVARMIAAPEGAPERARLRSLLVDAEAASVGFNRDGGGLGPEARAAIRAAVEGGSLSPVERMELGAAGLMGDASLAGAVFQDVPGLRWWVAGIEVQPGAAAPVGGLVDVRWDAPAGWERGRMVATLGPEVRVDFHANIPNAYVTRGETVTCAWFADEPRVRWREGGLTWGRAMTPERGRMTGVEKARPQPTSAHPSRATPFRRPLFGPGSASRVAGSALLHPGPAPQRPPVLARPLAVTVSPARGSAIG